ncbi:MAG TPA: DUF1192 domain-containing protein [Rhizobiaceae bacterium]|jgi:uncharacterized small protein (DUF1192 family)|nr:DUF1192 domain-containing protein [Rhizobiaceae bacterium]
MSLFDDEPVKRAEPYRIGQDLSFLSIDELKLRITELREEIGRLEKEIDAKGSTRSAAESFFRKP